MVFQARQNIPQRAMKSTFPTLHFGSLSTGICFQSVLCHRKHSASKPTNLLHLLSAAHQKAETRARRQLSLSESSKMAALTRPASSTSSPSSSPSSSLMGTAFVSSIPINRTNFLFNSHSLSSLSSSIPFKTEAQSAPWISPHANLFNPFAKPLPTPPQSLPKLSPPARVQPVPSRSPSSPSSSSSSSHNPANNPPLRLFESATPSRKPPNSPPSFVTQAVRTVGTSVVRIDTERLVRPSVSLDPLLDDPNLAKLFGDGPTRPRLERGQGSGFIISSDGYLLTNAHVVRNAQKVTVTLTDGRSFAGVVKGSDEYLDLAVVKVDSEGRNLPVAPLGASSDLEVGDWVIAVGNPVGLDNTVTLGIVSSLNRSSSEVGIPEKRLNLIQTSASLNPGSSGGPICNQWGEVVGISTAVRANAEAIGFAIPIDIAKDVASELAKGKSIAHAFVGIKMTNLTPALARQNNKDPNSFGIVPEIDGALVVRVIPKSPAADSGLRRNDVIVAIDGQAVKNAKDVQSIVDRSRVGQVVTVHVLRGDSSSPMQMGIKTANLSMVKKEQQFSNRPELLSPPRLPSPSHH